jgi:hypothetical protein
LYLILYKMQAFITVSTNETRPPERTEIRRRIRLTKKLK